MAKRELEAPEAGEELRTAKGRASDINRREERCCQVYEEGIKSVNAGGHSSSEQIVVFQFIIDEDKNHMLRMMLVL